MLRADGLAEQLVLTQDLADELIIFTPSERVFLADYLEVLSWYRACKWGPCLLDNLDQGDITITADRYGSRLNTRRPISSPAIANYGQKSNQTTIKVLAEFKLRGQDLAAIGRQQNYRNKITD
jgi:hypothetical protein